MVKDGTNRDRRRVKAGAKSDLLNEKLAESPPATHLEGPLASPLGFEGAGVGDGAVLAGKAVPESLEYLSGIQRDSRPLGADIVYRGTWHWLDECGCARFASKRLIEAYAQVFARYVQCEQAISKFGLFGKHPIMRTAIASLFVAMSQPLSKQANVLWYEIFDVVRANSLMDYPGPAPADSVMERLLQVRL